MKTIITSLIFLFLRISQNANANNNDVLTITSPIDGSIVPWSTWSSKSLHEVMQMKHGKDFPLSLNIDLELGLDRFYDINDIFICTQTTILIEPKCFQTTGGHIPNIGISFPKEIIPSTLNSRQFQNNFFKFDIKAWLETVNKSTIISQTQISVYLETPPLTQYNPEDFTVIIQGPLHPIGINSIKYYLKVVSRVIISCWSSDDISPLLPILNEFPSNITLIVQPIPVTPDYFLKWQTTSIYQFTSTLSALHLVTTPYSIKLRSDESFENISPFLTELHAFPSRLISCNIYISQSSAALVSDHCFAANTTLLTSTVEKLLSLLSGDESKVKSFMTTTKTKTSSVFPGRLNSRNVYSCEMLLLRAFYQARSDAGLISDDRDDLLPRLSSKPLHPSHLDLINDAQMAYNVVSYVPISSLQPYFITCNQRRGMSMHIIVSENDDPNSVSSSSSLLSSEHRNPSLSSSSRGELEHVLLVSHSDVPSLLKYIINNSHNESLLKPKLIELAHDELFYAINQDKIIGLPNNKMAVLQRFQTIYSINDFPAKLFSRYLSLRILFELIQKNATYLVGHYLDLSVELFNAKNATSLLQQYISSSNNFGKGNQYENEAEYLSVEEATQILKFLVRENLD